MAGGESPDLPRDEDYGTRRMADEEWWFESVEAFIAECRVKPPPRLLQHLAAAPLVDERTISRFSGLSFIPRLGCTGCGCDRDRRTRGCKTCVERHKSRREKRAA